jgi:hypothetical protein
LPSTTPVISAAASRGPEPRFTCEQGIYTPLRDRATHFPFNPATQKMRADAWFERLVRALGFTDHWAQAAV